MYRGRPLFLSQHQPFHTDGQNRVMNTPLPRCWAFAYARYVARQSRGRGVSKKAQLAHGRIRVTGPLTGQMTHVHGVLPQDSQIL